MFTNLRSSIFLTKVLLPIQIMALACSQGNLTKEDLAEDALRVSVIDGDFQKPSPRTALQEIVFEVSQGTGTALA